jgi:hypothetical protein
MNKDDEGDDVKTKRKAKDSLRRCPTKVKNISHVNMSTRSEDWNLNINWYYRIRFIRLAQMPVECFSS